ncbi:MAG: 50S ribosomal protein L35 [Planctomycetes bacterium]|jgi:large subunit ribosomal protein L35|nr:50S ribosomal protein L35 [Phycisphaerae bacterium]NBB95682.1 50S ribosomal protein L35 [Planctomycetota bacterium]
MPKMKTNKAVAKRVKISATGKVRRYSPGSGHLKSRKTSKQLRNFRKPKMVAPRFARQLKRMLAK